MLCFIKFPTLHVTRIHYGFVPLLINTVTSLSFNANNERFRLRVHMFF